MLYEILGDALSGFWAHVFDEETGRAEEPSPLYQSKRWVHEWLKANYPEAQQAP